MFSAHHPLASDCWQIQRQTQCSPRCAAKAGSVVVGVFSSHGAIVVQQDGSRISPTNDEDSYSMKPKKTCGTCSRDPERMNGEFSECSHPECPYRRQAWSERPSPAFKGPWAKNVDADPKPLDVVLKGRA